MPNHRQKCHHKASLRLAVMLLISPLRKVCSWNTVGIHHPIRQPPFNDHIGLFSPRSRLFLSSSATPSSSNTNNGDVTFLLSSTSLQHLQNTELPDDYSRPWSATKIQALAAAILVGTLCSLVSIAALQQVAAGGEDDSIEKIFFLFGALGAGAGWYFGGGSQVAQDERPINGGYDRKLIADRPRRLHAIQEYLMSRKRSIRIRTRNSADPLDKDRLALAQQYAQQVHEPSHVALLESTCQTIDRPQRFHPTYSRTLIDEHSYAAALSACCDWMDSVDAALSVSNERRAPQFALVRPPSHHACRNKAMGGCLLNSVAIAAHYALDQHPTTVKQVAILDIDAHHGNGIAHTIQDNPAIRYCSLHEALSSSSVLRQTKKEDDPRSAETEDTGPLQNVCNINLPSGTTWESGYRRALVEQAIPFLQGSTKEGDFCPDLLLIAAGFDALDADLTSKLRLTPADFGTMGQILEDQFGSKVAFGLEGGYCWKDNVLCEAVDEFVEAWRRQ